MDAKERKARNDMIQSRIHDEVKRGLYDRFRGIEHLCRYIKAVYDSRGDYSAIIRCLEEMRIKVCDEFQIRELAVTEGLAMCHGGIRPSREEVYDYIHAELKATGIAHITTSKYSIRESTAFEFFEMYRKRELVQKARFILAHERFLALGPGIVDDQP